MSGFADPIPYRGLDTVAGLTPCSLPLAVFDWDGQGLSFVDAWSARRRPVRPSAAVVLAEVVGDDRAADGEARFLQFQDQLAGLLTTAAGTATRAVDAFPLLPPAGLVPIAPLAAVQPLLKLARAADTQVPQTEPARPRLLPKALLEERRRLQQFGIDRTVPGKLGALSEELRLMQQDIQGLQAAVDALNVRLGGGPPQGSASAQALGRRLAVDVIGALADTAGDGVDPVRFFSGVNVRLGVVDHETVDFTVRRSWYDEPVRTGTDPLSVFFVLSGDGQSAAPYLLFAKRQRGIRWISPAWGALDA
jgi:hypothetical protein